MIPMTLNHHHHWHQDWGQLLAGMGQKTILVVGDVMLDRFVSGDVERISPEAPVPVFRLNGENHMAGGAANVARNLAHYGVRVHLIGVVGKDDGAKELKKALAPETNIAFTAIADSQRQTTIKTRFTASGQQMLRVDHETSMPISSTIQTKFLGAVKAGLKTADALIISDYDKGVVSKDTAQAIIAMARQNRVEVIVDPKKPDPSIFKGADLMTPNLDEFKHMTQKPLGSDGDVAKAADSIMAKHKINAVLVTLGARGMILNQPKKPYHHESSLAQSVFDVSGAGDTVVATLGAARAVGASMEDSARLANIAAGLVVGKAGTATILAGEILATTAPPYLMAEQDVMQNVKDWQEAGLIVGFTNGCFDVLHPGHLWLLEQAAKHCDRLVAGVNSNQSAQRLKGQDRPYQSESRRIAALAALPMVDGAVIFNEQTPAKLIAKLKPDRLIKGGDYKAKDVIGRKTVLANGGKVIIIPLKKGFSTSRLV